MHSALPNSEVGEFHKQTKYRSYIEHDLFSYYLAKLKY